MATSPLSAQDLPPVPSAQTLDNKGSLISQPWQQWFVNLRDKVNIIGASLVSLSTLGPPSGNVNSFLEYNGTTWSYSPVSTGVTPGSYTNADITVGADGRISAASNGTGGSGGYGTLNLDGGTLPLSSDDVIDGGALPYRSTDSYDAGTL